jgi:ribA/ribD-fused uncharacterized protein
MSGGLKFPSAEHAFQAAKTESITIKEQFLRGTPKQAKKLGRTIELRYNWEEIKLQVGEEVIRAKFAQNPKLASKLLATETEQLVEGNMCHDNFWGVCHCGKCGFGHNHLGEILMKIRGELERS